MNTMIHRVPAPGRPSSSASAAEARRGWGSESESLRSGSESPGSVGDSESDSGGALRLRA